MNKLIDGCKAGKERAQKELFRRYKRLFLGICLRYARNKSDAEDTLMEGFINIYSKIGQFSGKGSFEGWMKRIIVNTAIDRCRKQNNPSGLCSVDDIVDIESEEEDALNKLSAKEILEYVQKMPTGYRLVFNMYAVEGYSHKEIADYLDIKESTSRTQLQKARAWMVKQVRTNFN